MREIKMEAKTKRGTEYTLKGNRLGGLTMKDERIYIRIPEELKRDFLRICQKESINKSALLRRWIEDYVKERRDLIMTKVIKEIDRRDDFPVRDESYVVGQVEDGRYFFCWGGEYPREEWLQDGVHEVVPEMDIENGESGIEFFETEDEARESMNAAISAAAL